MSKAKGTKAAAAVPTGTGPEAVAHFWKVLKGGDVRELEETLFSASTNSDTGEVVLKRLPNAAALANTKNPKQLTPLCFAVDNGFEDHIPVLVKAGAKVDDHDGTKERRTALHAAVAAEEDVMVQNLLRCGADPRALDGEGRTVLHIAARMSSRHIFGFFLELEEVPLALDVLVEGAKIVPVEALKLLDVQDHSGATALHYAVGEVAGGEAAYQLAHSCVEYLAHRAAASAEHRVRVERIVQAVTKSGCTVLHLLGASGASDRRIAALCTRLLELGCPVAARDEDGLLALHYVASAPASNADVFAALVSKMTKADKQARRKETGAGEPLTALECAIHENNRAVIDWMVRSDGGVNSYVSEDVDRQDLVRRIASASLHIRQALVDSKLVSEAELDAVASEMKSDAADDPEDDDGDDPAAGGDFSGHGSTTFAGSRVQAARRAAAQRRATDADKKESQKVKETIVAASAKREEETKKAHSQLGLGAKVLIAFMFLSLLLPAVDLLMGSPRRK